MRLRLLFGWLLLGSFFFAQTPAPPKSPSGHPSKSTGKGGKASTHAGKSPAASAGSNQPFKPGVERWSIKTSLEASADASKAKSVKIQDLISFANAPGVAQNDSRYQDARIPAFSNPLKINEGELITTSAWLRLVAAEDDGDYHIQLTAGQHDATGCLISEVPKDDPAFVKSGAVRQQAAVVRAFIRDRLFQGQEPARREGSMLTGSAYVTITGQFFFDDPHVGDPPRGKRGMKASTLWELHPVVAIAFAPRPK